MNSSRSMDLSGRIALVTGASSGLGAHFAKVLAAANATVFIAARRLERLQALADEIGGNVHALEMDITDSSSVNAAFDRAEQIAGTVDILVNNAGINSGGDCLRQTEQDFDTVVNVNIKGVWRASTVCANRLAQLKKPGAIINVASILGINAAPQLSLYAMTKSAVIQLTKGMALDLWNRNIRVNALCPGYFPTELNQNFFVSEAGRAFIKRIPPKRLGRLNELDGPLLMLASDAGSFVSGSVITVDGGHSARLM